jgi:hypothetical protein
MVSLTRLEAAAREQIEAGKSPTDEMMHLAGLTRIRYVFFYPETKDVVIAGPAEPWTDIIEGQTIGIGTGRATLQLADLCVALRAYPPSGKKTPVILVSIDPTAEGLAAMQQFLRQYGASINPGDAESIVNGLRTSLGMQNIRVGGISPNTHFAQVLIEADYRMKLIGIGLEKPPVKLASYVDNAKPGMVKNNAMQRWYFVPDYKCVKVTADDMGMELVGDTVKLVGENEVVGRDGNRSSSGTSNKASAKFVEGFTKKYGEIANRVPVYAQMRNCIDMAVVAAFIQEHKLYDKCGWNLDVFGDENKIATETLNTPRQVETTVAAVVKNNTLMTPVGGGVTIHPNQAIESSNITQDEEGKLMERREAINLAGLPAGQWWWDAAEPEAPAKGKKAKAQ